MCIYWSTGIHLLAEVCSYMIRFYARCQMYILFLIYCKWSKIDPIKLNVQVLNPTNYCHLLLYFFRKHYWSIVCNMSALTGKGSWEMEVTFWCRWIFSPLYQSVYLQTWMALTGMIAELFAGGLPDHTCAVLQPASSEILVLHLQATKTSSTYSHSQPPFSSRHGKCTYPCFLTTCSYRIGKFFSLGLTLLLQSPRLSVILLIGINTVQPSSASSKCTCLIGCLVATCPFSCW